MIPYDKDVAALWRSKKYIIIFFMHVLLDIFSIYIYAKNEGHKYYIMYHPNNFQRLLEKRILYLLPEFPHSNAVVLFPP